MAGPLMLRGVLFVFFAMTLTACLTGPTSQPSAQQEGSPDPVQTDSSPNVDATLLARLANLPNPTVTIEAKSKWGNGPVYTVMGKSYRVMAHAQGFSQEGLASWYGTKFHGRRTSSGEPFDMFQLSAAHRHLPLPSYVEVTNVRNGLSTVVKVNDRGPFHSDRVIDLSYAAAVKLGFYQEGTAPVRIKVLTPIAEPPAYMLQTGAFRVLANADRLQNQLQALTGVPGVILKTSKDGFYRVQLGPIKAGSELERVRTLLDAANYSEPRLIPSLQAE